jgi:hypothetical protein
MVTQSIPAITEEEYLRLERAAEYRSEFVDGQILAMSRAPRGIRGLP